MNFSIFEIMMLICFGVSWPVAIIKTLRSKTVKGISPFFYWLVLTGYISGTLHKIIFSKDIVIILYIINCVTVGTQTALYYYYRNRDIDTAL
jgi:hypothetical protein